MADWGECGKGPERFWMEGHVPCLMAVGATDVMLFSASQIDCAHHFSLGLSRRETFFGSEGVYFCCCSCLWGFVVLWHFFFSLEFCLFIKTKVFRQQLGFPCPVQ